MLRYTAIQIDMALAFTTNDIEGFICNQKASETKQN